MPRKAHFWQVGLLEVVLSEYLDKCYNFTNLIFMISSLQDSAVGPGCLIPRSLPSHCFSGFRRCQCQCQCRDQFLFAPSIPVAARTIVLITNPLTACFFFYYSFFFAITCYLIFAASVANLALSLIYTARNVKLFFSCTHKKLNNT